MVQVATGTDAEKAPFLSGMVSTRKPDKGEVLFEAKGQFILSVRAKLPSAPSSWSGIWMTGTKGDWPACGEIDVLEAKGWQPKDYQVNTHTLRVLVRLLRVSKIRRRMLRVLKIPISLPMSTMVKQILISIV